MKDHVSVEQRLHPIETICGVDGPHQSFSAVPFGGEHGLCALKALLHSLTHSHNTRFSLLSAQQFHLFHLGAPRPSYPWTTTSPVIWEKTLNARSALTLATWVLVLFVSSSVYRKQESTCQPRRCLGLFGSSEGFWLSVGTPPPWLRYTPLPHTPFQSTSTPTRSSLKFETHTPITSHHRIIK